MATLTDEQMKQLMLSGQYSLELKNIFIEAGENDTKYISVSGNFVRCYKSSDSFYLGFDSNQADTPMDQGIAIPGIKYERITVKNPDKTKDLTVSLICGFGYVEDNRFFIRAGGLPVQSPQIWEQNNLVVSLPPVSGLSHPLKISDFNANRVEIIIENVSETTPVRIGNTQAKALTGPIIPPGGTRILTCCAEFYAAVENGQSADLIVSASYYDFNTIFGV